MLVITRTFAYIVIVISPKQRDTCLQVSSKTVGATDVKSEMSQVFNINKCYT